MTKQDTHYWQATLTLSLPENFDLGDEINWPPSLSAPPLCSFYEKPDKDTLKIELIFAEKPDQGQLKTIHSVLEKAVGVTIPFPVPEKKKHKDWVRESYKFLQPILAGNFYVYGHHDRGTAPRDAIAIEIEAAQAFGTGHHETTKGCLEALHDLKNRLSPETALDLGCGTGILAIAMKKLWPGVKVIGSDLEEKAVETARENASKNRAETIQFLLAEGFDHRKFRGKKFDLVAANILAGPLTYLAADIAKHLNKNGVVILAGLLENQESLVTRVFEDQNLSIEKRFFVGDWPILILKK